MLPEWIISRRLLQRCCLVRRCHCANAPNCAEKQRTKSSPPDPARLEISKTPARPSPHPPPPSPACDGTRLLTPSFSAEPKSLT